VALCYCFQWEFLRAWTLQLNLHLDALLGVYLEPISSTSVLWRGHVYRYVIACTMADVWCGSLPLLWRTRLHPESVGLNMLSNLRTLLLFTPALLLFNVCRLSLSDVLVAHGVSWNLGHNVVSGLAYFLIWQFLTAYPKWDSPVNPLPTSVRL
jgi:hypothetical protein